MAPIVVSLTIPVILIARRRSLLSTARRRSSFTPSRTLNWEVRSPTVRIHALRSSPSTYRDVSTRLPLPHRARQNSVFVWLREVPWLPQLDILSPPVVYFYSSTYPCCLLSYHCFPTPAARTPHSHVLVCTALPFASSSHNASFAISRALLSLGDSPP